jgi:hypothetical protein
MRRMSALLLALGDAARAVVRATLDRGFENERSTAIALVNERREACSVGAIRRAQLALEQDGARDRAGDEWLGYAALLVHVDRIMRDLTAPLPE